MKQFNYVIKDREGIHARPAGMLVKAAKEYASSIQLAAGDRSADVKRLMALMSLGIKAGTEITITVEGVDEEEAAAAMERFLKEKL